MDFDQNGFYRKLEEEIARLQQIAARLDGLDRDQVLDMIHALELECERFRTSERDRTLRREEEREKAQGSIIEILNEIELQVRELEVEAGQGAVKTREEAERRVNRFFLDCQVAEDRIKHHALRGYLTREQVEDLNTQLRALVHRMTAASKRSRLLLDAVLETYEAQMFS